MLPGSRRWLAIFGTVAPAAARQLGAAYHARWRRRWCGRGLLWGSLLTVLGGTIAGSAGAAKCLLLSSYHQGYEWSDGIAGGVRAVLKEHCELQQFDLDAKRLKDPQDIQRKVAAARRLIETWQPDVVIAADDDAAKYLLMPFYKDHRIPFVFCGINWTVEEYGFPYKNATGMVEVAPLGPLFARVTAILPQHGRAFYLGADTASERKNLQHVRAEAGRHGMQLEARLVDTTDAWLSEFQAAQAYDFVMLGSRAGINDWHHEKVQEHIRSAQRLSLTNHEGMMPYAMLGFTKVPQEQGEWAAQTALAILAGAVPVNIPIVPNRKWDILVNMVLLAPTGIQLPRPLLQKAKKVS